MTKLLFAFAFFLTSFDGIALLPDEEVSQLNIRIEQVANNIVNLLQKLELNTDYSEQEEANSTSKLSCVNQKPLNSEQSKLLAGALNYYLKYLFAKNGWLQQSKLFPKYLKFTLVVGGASAIIGTAASAALFATDPVLCVGDQTCPDGYLLPDWDQEHCYQEVMINKDCIQFFDQNDFKILENCTNIPSQGYMDFLVPAFTASPTRALDSNCISSAHSAAYGFLGASFLPLFTGGLVSVRSYIVGRQFSRQYKNLEKSLPFELSQLEEIKLSISQYPENVQVAFSSALQFFQSLPVDDGGETQTQQSFFQKCIQRTCALFRRNNENT